MGETELIKTHIGGCRDTRSHRETYKGILGGTYTIRLMAEHGPIPGPSEFGWHGSPAS